MKADRIQGGSGGKVSVLGGHNSDHFEKKFRMNTCLILSGCRGITLRCVIHVVCVTNEREGSVVKQHN